MTRAESNTQLLTNIYRKGLFGGHGFLCQPPQKPLWERGDYTLSDELVTEWVPDIVEHYRTQAAWLETLGDHSVPMAELGTGTHLYAAAFGCPVHEYEESNPCALPAVRNATEADQLEQPDVWKSPTLYRVFELAEAATAELGTEVYFGPPDLQTGFDTAALVWEKSDFFCAMLADPEAVKRLVATCANLLRTFLLELRKEFPNVVPGHCPRSWVPTDMGFWASNDECGAFNTELFEEFCLPEMAELSETFGSLGMHCCADAEHQFESFKKIPNFYAFNRVAGNQGWDTLLEHFDGPDAPVHVLGWQPPQQVEKLIRAASPETRFIFVHAAQTLDDAKRWLAAVREVEAPNC